MAKGKKVLVPFKDAKPRPKTNGKRNREAGHNFEREGAKNYSKYFHDVVTTRSCNRARDGDGIDLCSLNELENGRLPLDISYKSYAKAGIPYVKILSKIPPGRIKVLHHRYTKKSKTGTNFITQGEYVIMEEPGYNVFLQHVYAIQILRELAPEAVKVLENMYGLKLLNFTHQLPKTNDRDTTNDGSSR